MSDHATMIQFDWENVEGIEVDEVLGKRVRRMNDGSLQCEQLAFVLDDQAVALHVNPDTDEVTVSLAPFSTTHAEWQALGPLREIVGRRLGWCWIGRNYRGYLDTFTVALDGIDPAFSFTGIASALHCTRVTPVLA